MVRVGDATSPIAPWYVPPHRAEDRPAQGYVLGATCGITFDKIAASESACWVRSFSLF